MLSVSKSLRPSNQFGVQYATQEKEEEVEEEKLEIKAKAGG
jgi:hypothetical protein